MSDSITHIIAGCKKQKIVAQKALYDEYATLLYAICKRYVKEEALAQDIIHDCFIVIFNEIKKLKDDKALVGWMKKIVVNESLRVMKEKKKLVFEEHKEYSSIEEEISEPRIPKNVLLQFLNQLPEGCKVVFNMYVIEEYSHKEIADQLGVSESTSKTQFHKAKQLLKEMITHYESKIKIA